jgi:hypothetical protein
MSIITGDDEHSDEREAANNSADGARTNLSVASEEAEIFKAAMDGEVVSSRASADRYDEDYARHLVSVFEDEGRDILASNDARLEPERRRVLEFALLDLLGEERSARDQSHS